MNFLQHILEIDRRVEDMRQEEYQKILFGFEADTGSQFGLGISHSTPMVNGGVMHYKDGIPSGYSMPNVNGGSTYYNRHGIPQGYTTPDLNGGSFYHPYYKVPKPTYGKVTSPYKPPKPTMGGR